MKAVIEDDMSICQASEKHHGPKSTVGDRVSGWVLPGATSGPASYLTSEEEEELVTFVCHVARQELMDLYPLLRNDDVWGETVGIN